MNGTDIEYDRGILNYRRYLQGDDEGLAEIIRDYGDRLLRYILGFVGDPDVAEDLLAETFLKLIVRRRAFREESSLKTYLYAIGRNEALGWLRRQRRAREVSLEQALPLASHDRPELRAYADDRRRRLYAAMETLHEDYREILRLVYFEELSCDEAAAVMRKSRKQTENLLYRGKKSLRCALEKEGFSYEDL